MKETKYTQIVYVNSDVLSQWLVQYGNLNYFYSFFKHKALPNDYYLDLIYLDGEVWYSNEDIKIWESAVLQYEVEFINFILKIIKDKMKNMEKLKNSKKSLSWKLSELFKIGACTSANGLLESACYSLVKRIFSKYSLSGKERAVLLYMPFKKTKMVAELEDLQKIISDLKKKFKRFELIRFQASEISSRINDHIKKYAFLGMNYFGGRAWEEIDIIKRVEENWNLEVIKEKEIVKYPKLNEEDSKIINIIKEVIYVRTARNESITSACYSLYEELKNKANELGLTYDDVIFMTPNEIFNFDPNNKKFIERKRGFGMFVKDKRIIILTGVELKELKERTKGMKSINEIKGLIVSPGKVRGVVQIVDEKSDFSSFKRGNILVTKYTTPAFSPIISKASGIITDIGGMTSHAAIVSREFMIPCIVGTEIATRVLKDGYLVEIDAEKGIVNVLKRD